MRQLRVMGGLTSLLFWQLDEAGARQNAAHQVFILYECVLYSLRASYTSYCVFYVLGYEHNQWKDRKSHIAYMHVSVTSKKDHFLKQLTVKRMIMKYKRAWIDILIPLNMLC